MSVNYVPKAPKPKINNEAIVMDAMSKGVRVKHFITGNNGGRGKPEGYTIAYRKINRNSRTCEVAVAVCHPNDCFSRKHGTQIALTNFFEGKRIVVPFDYDYGPFL